jgi:HEAT repeat protein
VDALSVADPTSGSVLAFECLFDCEPVSRGAAVRTVDLDDPAARDRLRQLAEDPLEEDDVRAAAAIRVA